MDQYQESTSYVKQDYNEVLSKMSRQIFWSRNTSLIVERVNVETQFTIKDFYPVMQLSSLYEGGTHEDSWLANG
jgi:hypothetical protein